MLVDLLKFSQYTFFLLLDVVDLVLDRLFNVVYLASYEVAAQLKLALNILYLIEDLKSTFVKESLSILNWRNFLSEEVV